MKIIGICGSARKHSYNMALLNYINNDHDKNINFEIINISNLPLFNEDLEESQPLEVTNYINKLMTADAFIIATPEYNYSIPPLLKNALDWASRAEINPFENKYISIISASLGMLGGARAQYHLRQVLVALNANVINRPEVFVGLVNEKIDDNGNIIDKHTKGKVMDAFNQLVNTINL